MVDTKLTGYTPDIAEENIAALRQLFPEICCEDRIDFEKLRQLLGEYVEDEKERYNFTWNGKGRALHLSQQPTRGTLRPCPEESKDWDTTENLYIEGDNLEVLKLLQKSYHGKVKMIYIDPPYNTGNDFVYPDNYSDNLRNYLRMTGQIDEEGKAYSANPESNGRYHSDWLNMIYPRLRLARNLLQDDGVIFISIDYNENSKLRMILDEIFGQSNFIGEIYWESKTKSQNTSTSYNKLQPKVEMILVYTKQSKRRFNLITKGSKDYPFQDEQGKYREYPLDVMNAAGIRGRETMIYDITDSVSIVSPPEGKQWKLGQAQVATYQNSGNLIIRDGKVIIKMRPEFERGDCTEPFWGLFTKEIGTAESAKKELTDLIGPHGLETIKPIPLITRFMFHCSNREDLILDFFSGSSTTAHAVIRLNAEDGGHRRFIMVQLPEPCKPDSEAYKAGYKNICEIGKERIRRAGEKIKTELREKSGGQTTLDGSGISPNPDSLDIGFKVFKLATSNILAWRPDTNNLNKTLTDYVDNLDPNRSELDLVYELMIKEGLSLTEKIEKRTIAGKNIYSIGYGLLQICLDDHITTDFVREMVKNHKPEDIDSWRVIFKDNGFASDSDKLNAREILKAAGLAEEAFRTI